MTDLNFNSQKLIFVTGKGGVGKTVFSEALAKKLSRSGKKVLLCHILQIEGQEQNCIQRDTHLWEITLNSKECFKEYVILKVKFKGLYSLFLGSKITDYLQKAAPGVKEMVLLGKLWYERQNYDHIIVDMPSTGHALTMLHTPFNFANLFPGGPIYNDSHEMIATFSNPELSSFIILALAEEMPSQESYELQQELLKLMPKNPARIIYNRIIHLPKNLTQKSESPIITKALDHLKRKEAAQQQVLRQFSFLKPDLSLTEISEVSEQQRIEGILKQLP